MKKLEQYIGRTKGVLTVVEILKRTPNNKYTEVKCICSRCGQHSTVRLDRISTSVKYAENYCSNCKESYLLEQASSRLIGKTNGVLTCIDIIGYKTDISNYKSLRVKCKCSRCGSETIVRAARLIDKKNIPMSCNKCYYDLLGTLTHKRLFEASGAVDDTEYIIKQKVSASLSKFKSGARSRDLGWELSDDEAITLMYEPCYYCGDSPSFGIDRINSSIGYYRYNTVPCCGMCNIMKNKFTQDAFLNRVYKIYSNLHLEGSTTISKESTPQAYGGGNGGYPEKDSDIV